MTHDTDQGAARLLERVTARADREGVLTWLIEEEGTTIRAGDVIADEGFVLDLVLILLLVLAAH